MAGMSGVKARITRKGIEYANAEIHRSISNKLNALHIPDLEGDGRDYEWHIRSIENQGCSLSESEMDFVPHQNGLKWALKGLSLKLKGDWKAKYSKAFIKVSDNGRVEVKADGATLEIIIRLGVDENRRPSITLATCDVHINDVDVTFHGGAAFIYNLFSDMCGRKIKRVLKEQVHRAMERLINEDGARKLNKLKLSVPLTDRYTLDYGLTQTPSVQANNLETQHKGQVYWTGDNTEAPITPKPFPSHGDDSKMLYIWLSDFTANTLLLVGHINNSLEYGLTSEKLPDDLRILLNTSSSSERLCIGRLIPQIGKKYPNSQVEAKIVSSSAPVVQVTPETVKFECKSQIDLIAHTSDHKAPLLVSLSMDFSFSLKLLINDEKVTAYIRDPRTNIDILESNIGNLNKEDLNPMLTLLISKFLVPKLQKILDKSVDLPVSNDVRFRNPEITLLDGSLVIGTDVEVRDEK